MDDIDYISNRFNEAVAPEIRAFWLLALRAFFFLNVTNVKTIC